MNRLPSKSMVTRLAAIQLVIMEVMTSLTLRWALKSPGMHPHSAPARMAAQKASSHTRGAGTTLVSMPSATMREAAVPMRYCPGAPMLKSPVL